MSAASRRMSSPCRSSTSSGRRTNEKLRMSAWRAMNGRSSRSFAVSASRGRSESGKLTPLPALRLAPPGRISVMVTAISSDVTVSTEPPILPSSNHTHSFGRTAVNASERVQPIRWTAPSCVPTAGSSDRVRITRSPRCTRCNCSRRASSPTDVVVASPVTSSR